MNLSERDKQRIEDIRKQILDLTKEVEQITNHEIESVEFVAMDAFVPCAFKNKVKAIFTLKPL